MRYKLGLNIQTHDYRIRKRGDVALRYIQCGIADAKGRFSGLISDYAGGGEQQDFYFLHGKNLDAAVDMSYDEQADKLNAEYPGLLDQIFARLRNYAIWDKENPNYIKGTEKFKKAYKAWKAAHPDWLFSRGANLKPINVANTIFNL